MAVDGGLYRLMCRYIKIYQASRITIQAIGNE